MKERFRDAQMRGRADRQKLRESFNDSQHHRKQVIVQASSKG